MAYCRPCCVSIFKPFCKLQQSDLCLNKADTVACLLIHLQRLPLTSGRIPNSLDRTSLCQPVSADLFGFSSVQSGWILCGSSRGFRPPSLSVVCIWYSGFQEMFASLSMHLEWVIVQVLAEKWLALGNLPWFLGLGDALFLWVSPYLTASSHYSMTSLKHCVFVTLVPSLWSTLEPSIQPLFSKYL